ncbi:hypothetical protein CH063_11598 [Colletotrichum higginsianum]|nr:hypothetical protein CH063_11598 [Colletotrichum higginsianum]
MPDDHEVDDYSSEVSLKFREVSTTKITPGSKDRDDPGRRQELEALSAAMMTVDNGFENQWWYQGERQQTIPLAGDLLTSTAHGTTTATAQAIPQTPMPPPSHDSRESMGWATDQGGSRDAMMSGTLYNPSVLVSPMSEYASPRIHRSMTTRSEELFL